ncbi:MAG: hypothetical protein JWN79_2995 [Gemmatimonadetes bacterium]|jgi:hypothetical protein|nr:hypothetical protein [Gemmatimonadota bacterium]
MGRRGALGVWLVAAVAAGCGDGSSLRFSIAGASARVALAAAKVTGQEAPMATALAAAATEASGHPGFDTGDYPGDDAMRAWRGGNSPYEWTGYYLPSPCHPDQGWSGKRETLTQMGYGLAVLYVGQQTWGRKPGAPHRIPVKVSRKQKVRVGHGRKRRTVTRTVTRTVMRLAPPPASDATCNADFVKAERGEADGVDAAERAAREGFAPGTVVFLDLERMDFLHQQMRDYYTAWVRAVLADGRYRPGIYVHTYNADVVYNDVKAVYAAANILDEPPFWVAKSQGFELTKLPHEVGHAFASIWQGVLDVEQTFNGKRIKLDVNVAGSPSPSAVMGRTDAPSN